MPVDKKADQCALNTLQVMLAINLNQLIRSVAIDHCLSSSLAYQNALFFVGDFLRKLKIKCCVCLHVLIDIVSFAHSLSEFIW